MKKITLSIAILFATGLLATAFGESIVTLKSGDVLRGDIVSDTNDVVQIRAFNANRTISSLRNIPRTDIQNIYTETPAEAAERVDFFSLAKFQLNPDQEQSTDFCTQWIAAFEKFLRDYPKSDKTVIVQQRIEMCRAELKHVADGEVKFGDRWMTPVEKKPLSLNKQLADLERQRASLAQTVAAAQGKLAGLQTKLQTLQDTQEPVYATRLVGPNHYAQQYLQGYRIVPNSERPSVQADIVACQERIGSGATALANLNAKIQNIQAQIPQAQRAYELALAKANQQPAPVVAPPPPPPAPTVEPVVVAPQPWIVQHWKAFAVSGGILLILAVLAYPLKRVLQKAEHTEAARDEERRVAREKLKKVFDRIYAEGERPGGQNAPDGDIVPIGRGEDNHGGGRWFIIGDSYIWAVQNNGREDDNWVYNNIVTKGHGAVGARVPMDPELVDYIHSEATATR